jgi:hypothetical protein
MDVRVSDGRLRELGLPGWQAGVLALLVGAWSILVIGTAAHAIVIPYPQLVPLLKLLVPAGFVGAIVLRRQPASTSLKLAAAWTALVTSALIAAVMIDTRPIFGLVIPAAALSALLCSRFPAASSIGLFALTGGFGSLGQFTGLPAREIAELLLLGLWIGAIFGYVTGARREAMVLWPGVAALAFYLLLTVLYAPTAKAELSAGLTLRSATFYLSAVLVLGYAGWGDGTQRRLAQGILVVAALVGGYATLRWLIGPAGAELALREERVRGDYSHVGGELTAFAPFKGKHQLGGWTAALVPFCLAGALMLRGNWRLVSIAGGALCGVALLASEMRAALPAAVLGMALVLVLYGFARAFPGPRLTAAGVAVIVALAVGGIGFSVTVGTSEMFTERYANLLSPLTDHAFKQRLDKWEAALEEIKEHPFGQGLDSAAPRRLNPGNIALSDFDNSYLKIAFEQGWAVVGVFVIALLFLLWGLGRRAVMTLDRQKAAIAIGACGTLASHAIVLTTGLYINGLQSLAAWMIIGLGVGQFAFDRGGSDGAGGATRPAADFGAAEALGRDRVRAPVRVTARPPGAEPAAPTASGPGSSRDR